MIRANTKNKWSRNQIEEIRWISTQHCVAPFDKTEITTDITKGKNSSLSTINITKHRKPSYRYITSTERNQRLKIVRGIDLPPFFFDRQNLMILQLLSLWVNLLPVLLFHVAKIIRTCYLENGIKVKDHSRPWPLIHRLLSHQHGKILGTQIPFLLTEKIRWFTKYQYANGRVK